MPSWTSPEKLQYINGFFNRWESKSDLENYGVEEYWASPEEFLEKGGGDCEDFAIIKYLALRYFGWPEQDLWLLLGLKKTVGEFHAVLAARTGEKLFILDNLSKPVYLLIPEKQYIQNFIPQYAINELGIWEFSESLPAAGGS
jgi:predicted transglutaminase-like cysteine proteinase